jgi:hypothetical protein
MKRLRARKLFAAKRLKPNPKSTSVLFQIAPELLEFIISFLTHESGFDEESDDNAIYRTLRATTKLWQMELRQHLFCFNLNMFRCRRSPRKAHSSWIHAICCGELGQLDPKELTTDVLIPTKARHTYRVPVIKDDDQCVMGRCCWKKITEMKNLRSLRLFSVNTDDLSDCDQLENLELYVKHFGLPLRLPSSLRRLTIDFTKTSSSELRGIRLNCPPNLITLKIKCDDCSYLGSINLNEDLQELVFDQCEHVDHVYGGANLRRLAFENCLMASVPCLERFAALEILELPCPDDEEGTTMDALLWRIGTLQSLRELILPIAPNTYRHLLTFTHLERLTVYDSCDAEKTKILFQLRTMQTVRCGPILLQKNSDPK